MTKTVKVGNILIGGGNPISVQSMTNTDTRNVLKTVEQINSLKAEGCEIVRVAVLDEQAADAVFEIKSCIDIPLVCDIHFDYKLALRVLDAGIDKLRINPGNIGDFDRIKAVVDKAKQKKVAIRIGVNSGSLSKKVLSRHGTVTADALVESAMEHVTILERLNFEDIIISIKGSGVRTTIDAYKTISQMVDYPLHIGITEAGTVWSGSIKSAVGIGAILAQGIGDTIRVSLTGDPVEEVKVAKEILKSLGLRRYGIEFVSCPTCGRTENNLIENAIEIEKRCKLINKSIKVAVMGCPVNGPGEAKDADVGVACGKGYGVIFKNGNVIRQVEEQDIVEALMLEVENY